MTLWIPPGEDVILTVTAPPDYDTSTPFFLRAVVDTVTGLAVLSASRTENGPPDWNETVAIQPSGDDVWPVWCINGVALGPARNTAMASPPVGAQIMVVAPPDFATYYPLGEQDVDVVSWTVMWATGLGTVAEGDPLVTMWANGNQDQPLAVTAPCAGIVTAVAVSGSPTPEIVAPGALLCTIGYESGGALFTETPPLPTQAQTADLSLLVWRNLSGPAGPPGTIFAGLVGGGAIRRLGRGQQARVTGGAIA